MNKVVIIGIVIAIVIGVTVIAAEQINQSDNTSPELDTNNETLVEPEETQGKHFTVGISETVGIQEP